MSDICIEVEITGPRPRDWNLYYYHFDESDELGAALRAAQKAPPGLSAEIKAIKFESRHLLSAISRVQTDPILSEYKSMLFDKSLPNYDQHVEWVAHAPIDELRQWVIDERRSEEENHGYRNTSPASSC